MSKLSLNHNFLERSFLYSGNNFGSYWVALRHHRPYLIVVAYFTYQICGEKFVMWRNIRFSYITDVEKSESSERSSTAFLSSPEIDLSSPSLPKKNKNVYSLWSFVAFYATSFCKNHIFANYAVLSRNLFCRDLRVFVWRKIEPKIVYVEKK